MRTYDEDSYGVQRVVLFECLSAFIISIIATVVYMLFNNDSIICNDYYCFAHRHSYVCYLGWSGINSFMGTFIWNTGVLITRFPLFYNTYIFLYNITHKEKVKKKEKKNMMDAFLNYERRKL